VGGGASWVLSGSYVLGALVSLIISARVIRRRLPPENLPVDKGRADATNLRPFWRQVRASSVENLGFSFNQLTTVALAARLGPGIATINAVAFRLANLPLAAVGTPLSQSVQSWLVQDVRNRVATLRRKLLALEAVWVCIAAVMAIGASMIVKLVYQRGAFTAHDSAAVVQIMTAYMSYFAIMATNQMLARILFALDRGGWYPQAMLPAYCVETLVQILIFHRYGLAGLVWVAVASEGFAAVALAIRTQIRIREVRSA
jgi:peptidoglycan biosynthesis protein MviN/MurJ (putative lipid II flippase)